MRFIIPRIRIRLRTVLLLAVVLLLGLAACTAVWAHYRYAISDEMVLPLEETCQSDYPEDPANRSLQYGQYCRRQLRLINLGNNRFDFIVEPMSSHCATVIFRDIDVSLMTPGEPEWTKGDRGLERIALTDRQWNRQQVRFPADSPHLEVKGGDGFEKANLVSAELAKNCLNAGLWEVLLFSSENGSKKLYYQSWFAFPLGHYKHIFEHNTGVSYWNHWYKLEHWSDPVGTPVRLDKLRSVTREFTAEASFDAQERIFASGEQTYKRRTLYAENIVTWGYFYSGSKVRFATFIPPGRYSVKHPWKNEYHRFATLDEAIFRDIVSPSAAKPLQELELVFTGKDGEKCRFFVSGFDSSALPELPVEKYPDGMYMPMGIGVPPFYQSYEKLEKNPPEQSPYFSVLLDSKDRWLNHHDIGVDGPVLHRDAKDPSLLHLYLLSYERQSLIGHWIIKTDVTQ